MDARGRVYVLYAVGTPTAATIYLIVSTDGNHFGIPVPVTDPLLSAGRTQGNMLVDRAGRVYVFWNDECQISRRAAKTGGAAITPR